MKVTRTSVFTGQVHTMDLDITLDQIERYLNGYLIQNAFPNLTNEEREFLKTGVTPEEWNEVMGSD